jgi:hypothetical protein
MTTTSTDRAAASLAVISEIYAEFGRGDIPAILETIGPNCRWESWADNHAQAQGVPTLQARSGPQGVAEFFATVGELEIHDFQLLDMHVLIGEERLLLDDEHPRARRPGREPNLVERRERTARPVRRVGPQPALHTPGLARMASRARKRCCEPSRVTPLTTEPLTAACDCATSSGTSSPVRERSARSAAGCATRAPPRSARRRR